MRSSFLVAVWLVVGVGRVAAQAPATPPPAGAAPTESMAQSTTTDADMTDAQARGKYRLGRELYGQGKFAEAAKEFETAYGLSGRGELLFNVYLAYRDAQDTPNAARALRGYLSAVPDAPDRAHLTARLAALEALIKADEAKAAQQRAEAEQAKEQAAAAERERLASEQRAADAEKRAEIRPSRPWWPWLVVGAGVAATGTGLVLGIMAASDADELRDRCVLDPRDEGSLAPLMPGTHCSPEVDVENERDAIQTQALIGDALWIGGAAITVTGVVLAFALPDEYPDEQPPPVTAACTLDACRAQLRLQF